MPTTTEKTSSAIGSEKNRIRYYLCALVVLWAFLYLPNLRTTPAWYGDETYVVHNSKYIFLGDFRNFALKNTFFHVSYPYQLPYSYVCGGFYYLFGQDILGPRFFNTLIGLITACTILILGRRRFGEIGALVSAILLLSYNQSVIHYRYVFAHNLLGLGLITTTLLLYEKSSPKADAKAGLGIMVAGLAHPLVTHVAIAAMVARLKRPKSWLYLCLPYTGFLSIYLALIYSMFGNTLTEDLLSFLHYYGNSSANNSSSLISNIFVFFSQDLFHVFAFLSLLLCLNKRNYILSICTLIPSLLLLQNRANLTVFYYQAMLILPNLCCLCGLGLVSANNYFFKRFPILSGNKIISAVPVCMILFWIIPNTLHSISGEISPNNAYWTTQNYHDVEEAAKWINSHTKSDDFVIANMNLAWLLHAKSTHLLQVAAWHGYRTHGFENGISHDRFIFDADISKAKYVALGDIDFRWTIGEIGVKEVLSVLVSEHWSRVWASETYVIYENPTFVR
jgi:hypothetical protein